MINFEVIKDDKYKTINELLDVCLKNLECKHISNINERTTILNNNAIKVGYDYHIFGSHRVENAISSEIDRIINMSNSQCDRAIRIVITRDGRFWSDNTHWTLAYLIKFNLNVKLRDVPFYIVDFRCKTPQIISYKDTLFASVYDLENAVNAASAIQERIDIGWRTSNLKYSINELGQELLLF
ncbi:MAG: hypothetical protein R3Y45_09405 [Bacillota bacterium]